MFRTRFGSLELTIRSLESEKIIMGSLESGEFGPLQLNTGYLTFSLKKTGFNYVQFLSWVKLSAGKLHAMKLVETVQMSLF